ncbi:hypothetical protein CEXT_400451 [Caerostris extrusa]|uniref:Uncharacterized protein n=1 Tax=Caerostris extrusa TaxID=172846 RepID=A0AAV4Q935_CAEEX|nr:hypothetical protein CEXT_400451 [Caerostris extrusa]
MTVERQMKPIQTTVAFVSEGNHEILTECLNRALFPDRQIYSSSEPKRMLWLAGGHDDTDGPLCDPEYRELGVLAQSNQGFHVIVNSCHSQCAGS